MICQHKYIIVTNGPQVGDVDNGGGCACGEGLFTGTLCLQLSLTVNLKLLYRLKSLGHSAQVSFALYTLHLPFAPNVDAFLKVMKQKVKARDGGAES